MNIALLTGYIPFEKSVWNNENVKLIIGSTSKFFDKKWLKERAGLTQIIHNKLQNSKDLFLENPEDPKEYEDVLSSVLNDYSTYHIFNRKAFNESLTATDHFVAKIVLQAINVIKRYKLDALITHDTPHSIFDYTLSKVAYSMGLKLYNVRRSTLPWRISVRNGLWNKSKPVIFNQDEPDALRKINLKHAESYFQNLKKEYDIAIPEYEKKRVQKYQGKIWSFKVEIENQLKLPFRPKRLMGSYFKYKAYKELYSLSIRPPESRKYVAFFLHFQPERTTCPEGGIFNSQHNAVRLLRYMLPEDVSIFVREHPSTFRNGLKFNSRVRPRSYYKSFLDLGNVYLGDLTQDSFNFIDQSIFTATITGTVAVESVLRGKPCVFFGDAIYSEMPGTIKYNSISNQDLEEYVKSIKDNLSNVNWIDFISKEMDCSCGELTSASPSNRHDYLRNTSFTLSHFLNFLTNKSE